MKNVVRLVISKIRNKQGFVIILIIGIVLMLAAESFSGNTQKESSDNAYIDSDLYRENLEKELSEILSSIKGVGRVRVMVTLENRNAVDISVKDRSGEAVLKRIGSTEEPVVTMEFYPMVKGVVIAAQGADSEEISEKLYYAAKAVLGIGGSKIAVVESK